MSRFAWIRRLFASHGLPARGNRSVKPRLLPLEDRLTPAAPFPEFVDPNPAPGNNFGETVVPLSTGNVVITSPGDDANGTDSGAVYLFNGANGALISTLRGSTAGDRVGTLYGTGVGGRFGAESVVALNNGNFIIRSPHWDNGSVVDAGAVTFVNGRTGLNGVVSAANSLVGGSVGDKIGSTTDNSGLVDHRNDVTVLPNGNYVVHSPHWDNGSAVDAGAVTFGSGTTGMSGVISTANSLIGSSAGDKIGGVLVSVLPNGNYVVHSPHWDNGSAVDAGAVTFGSGTTGVSGVVSAANSLVGSSKDDQVGSGVTILTNGNYVVRSPNWDNGTLVNVGAATWGNGVTGTTGAVSAANSLVGSSNDNQVGQVVTALTNGNYVVGSPNWDNGTLVNVGAATFANGTIGITGAVSPANSLIGGKDLFGNNQINTRVGFGIAALTNGNYVVESPFMGAMTFASGTTGLTGFVSTANSLTGSDGSVKPLSNGNYLVLSPNWGFGHTFEAGAVTFGNGTTGITGAISAANSLVGSTRFDRVGNGRVVELANGNFVIVSTEWNNGTVADASAVTFGSGTVGITGIVSAANSLVGTAEGDDLGQAGLSIAALANGNYVVLSRYWDNGAIVDAGAATFGNGTTGVSGVISEANSLVGSHPFDQIGETLFTVTELANGNYVVHSSSWYSARGASTFGSGTTGVSGVVSAANSLVGSTPGDRVGLAVLPLANGNYVVVSELWDNGAVEDAGAVTFGNGTTGVRGVVSANNSLVGTTEDDRIGSFSASAFSAFALLPLDNGNYVVISPYWDNGNLEDAGAMTFVNGTTGMVGPITPQNSLVGLAADTNQFNVFADNVNGTFFSNFVTDGGGRVRLGSQVNGFAPGGTVPPVVPPPPPGSRVFLRAVGAGVGGEPRVRVYNADGSERFSFLAYDAAFRGGVNVSTADVTGDGVDDLITGAGAGGGPHVKVFDGASGAEVMSFFAYDPAFAGGVWVAGGDVNGDGFADLVTGAGAGGGPHVKVFDGRTLAELASFYAYHTGFTGGVSVAVGDVNRDGRADVVTGAGAGGGPHVKVVNANSLNQTNVDGTIADDALLANYYAFDVAFTGGVNVSAGDFNGDGLADVVVGAGPGGGPHVKVVNAARAGERDGDRIADSALLANFYGYEEEFRGGVRVGMADGLAGGPGLILGAAPGGGPRVRVLRAMGLEAVEDFYADAPEFPGGVSVG